MKRNKSNSQQLRCNTNCKEIAQNEICRNHTGEHATSFALPSFWLYKPFARASYANCTMYCINYMPDLHTCTCYRWYYPVRPIQCCPYALYDQYVHAPPPLRQCPIVVRTLCHKPTLWWELLDLLHYPYHVALPKRLQIIKKAQRRDYWTPHSLSWDVYALLLWFAHPLVRIGLILPPLTCLVWLHSSFTGSRMDKVWLRKILLYYFLLLLL